MATHSSTLVWKISWTEEPGRLQSMESGRVGHDRATSLSLFTFMHWRRKWQPTPVFLPRESQGQRSLAACQLWGRRVGYDWSNLAAAIHVLRLCNLCGLCCNHSTDNISQKQPYMVKKNVHDCIPINLYIIIIFKTVTCCENILLPLIISQPFKNIKTI